MASSDAGNGLRILILDSGGMKALCQAIIIRELLSRWQKDIEPRTQLKVSECFDMIGGSGFGGLLAIMGGVLEMDGEQLVNEFVRFCETIFAPGVSVEDRPNKVEEEVKRMVRECSVEQSEDRMMLCEDDSRCKVFVCASSRKNMSRPRIFRTYRCRENNESNIKVWEAAQLTTSSPIDPPVFVGSGPLKEGMIGGEVRWANPTPIGTEEADRAFYGRDVACILSIGSGHIKVPELQEVSTSYFSVAASGAKDTHEDMLKRFTNHRNLYQRFDVAQGFQHLEEANSVTDMMEILAHTNSFLREQFIIDRVDSILKVLVDRPHTVPVSQITGKTPPEIGRVVDVGRRWLLPSLSGPFTAILVLVFSILIYFGRGWSHSQLRLRSRSPQTLAPIRIPTMSTCPPPTPYFTGRRVFLDQMSEYFSQSMDGSHICVLSGIGGSGKTQLGLQLVKDNRERFTTLIFLDASDRLTLENGFKAIGNQSLEEASVEAARAYLDSMPNEWLLFLDNADDPSLDLGPFIRFSRGNILITSRNPEVGEHAPDCHYEIGELETKEAIELLLRGVKGSTGDNPATKAIVQELGCLALAVNQARAYIAKTKCGLSGYLDLLRMNRKELLGTRPLQSTDGYHHSVWTTWMLSFKQLSDPAKTLLLLVSFLHHEGIPLQIFERAQKRLSTSLGRYTDVIPAHLANFLNQFWKDSNWNALLFNEVFNELSAFSLVTRHSSVHWLSLHPLVKEWSQEMGQHLDSSAQALVILAIPHGDGNSDYAFQRSLVPHLQALTRRGIPVYYLFAASVGITLRNGGALEDSRRILEDALKRFKELHGDEHLETMDILGSLASTISDLGLHKEALKMNEQVLDLRRRVLGPEHPDALTAMSDIALTLRHLGLYREAMQMNEQVIALELQISGPKGGHMPSRLTTMSNLALTLSDLGRHVDALQMNEQVLDLRKRILGPVHPNTLMSMCNLASTLSGLGRHMDALQMNEQVLDLRKHILGPEHPDTLMSMCNLASTLSGLGRHMDALQMYEQVIDLRKRTLGPEHPDTLMSMSNLAWTLSDLGRHMDALQMNNEVLDLRKRILGPEHPDTLTSMSDLALTLSDLGHHADALQMNREILGLRKRILGPEHPNTLTSMSNLAWTLYHLGHSQEALQINEQVLDLRKRVLGSEHPDTLVSMSNLALTLSNLGQHTEALQMNNEVLDLRKRVLGSEHPDTLVSMGNLALTLSNLGQHTEALQMNNEVLDLKKRILGLEHPNTLTSMSNLAWTLYHLGHSQEALQIKEQVLDLKKRILGLEHPETLTSMSNLAWTLYHLGHLQEALQINEQGLDLRKRVLGSEHPDTLVSMGNLALTLSNLGRHMEALQMNEQVLDLRKRVLGSEHPDTLVSMNNLALTLSNLGRHMEALQMNSEVLDLKKRVLGPEHPDTLTSMCNLAWTLLEVSRPTDALQMNVQVVSLMKRVLGPEHPNTLNSLSNTAMMLWRLGHVKEALQMNEWVIDMRKRIQGTEHPDTLFSMSNSAVMLSEQPAT
ncbi:hypothetical protein DL96DRAFT_1759141 [Flagelloscypha sp. PMI_526]|nr:hypothetical protein DL96DRAFT_1759141 [Flagelloscypha sp. PMI_526]